MISLLSVTKSVSKHSLVLGLENSCKMYMSNNLFMIYVSTFYTCVYDGEYIIYKMPSCITVASVWTLKLLVLILILSIVDHRLSLKYTYLACQNCTSIVLCLLLLLNCPIKAQVIVLL